MREAKILKMLQGESIVLLLICLVGIPKLFWVGVQGDFNVMVMELLGSNLEQLKNSCNCCFSPTTTLLLAEQIVSNKANINIRLIEYNMCIQKI